MRRPVRSLIGGGLNRADRMEVIAGALEKRGYRSTAIEKIFGATFRRLFAENWDVTAWALVRRI